MKQNEENSQKAQELTKEELEQVNGGKATPIFENSDLEGILKQKIETKQIKI